MMQAWVDLWNHEERPTAVALVRIGVGAVLLFELLNVGRLGMVPILFSPESAGGLADPLGRNVVPWIWGVLPHTTDSAWLLWGGATLAAFLTMIGAGTRLALVALMMLYAQLAQTFPLADRAIDMLLRNAMLILVFSSCGRVWSVDARLRSGSWSGDGAALPAWPRHLLVLQMAVVYSMAGVQKVGLTWWPMGDLSALYIVLQDPAVARFDPGPLEMFYPLTQLATAATMVFEWGALLLPLAFWYRATRDRPGRLRRWMNRLRFRDAWVAIGVALHLGIAVSMNLGVFPFGMLALYPAFFHPDELRALGARFTKAGGASA